MNFIRNIRNLLVCSCWASSSKTRERNYMRDIRTCVYSPDIRTCVYSPVPENGNCEIKNRNGNTYGTVHSVQLPFKAHSPAVFFFFKRAPVVWIERGNFFYAYRIYRTRTHTQHSRNDHVHRLHNNDVMSRVDYHIMQNTQR